MTLRKCNFELEQYSERDHPKRCHHWNYQQASELRVQGLFTSQPEWSTGYNAPLMKSALQRVSSKFVTFR